jgi:hypothetical protein
VDLNRNFPFKWGDLTGSSNNKCSETYHGTSAGSEPEVKAIIDYTKSIFPAAQQKLDPINSGQVAYVENSTVGVFLDVHAYSNLVLPPWSYSTTMVLLLSVIRFNIGLITLVASATLPQVLPLITHTVILALQRTRLSLELHSIRIVPPSRAQYIQSI